MPDNNIVNSNFYKIAVTDASDNVVGITAAPANVKITGSASAGQTLTADGSGGLAWATASSSAKTGQYGLFASAPPDSTWLVAGATGCSSTTYPALSAIYGTPTVAATSGNAVATCSAIAYGGGRYVLISTGTSATSKYSTDGVNWTNGGNLPVLSAGSWVGMCWNGSVFFAVAYSSGVNTAATSPDGVTWTTRTLPAGTGDYRYYSCTAAGSTLVAAQYINNGGLTNSSVVKSTDNGATWTSAITPGSKYDFIAYGGGNYIVATYNSSTGYWSTDAVTWTAFTLPRVGLWECAAHNGSYWLMGTASADTTMALSYDGINWSSTPTPGGGTNTTKIIWNGTRWVHVDGSNNYLRWSQNITFGWPNSPTAAGNQIKLTTSDGTGSSVVTYNSSATCTIKYTFTQPATFTAGTNPGVATSSGTWWIKS